MRNFRKILVTLLVLAMFVGVCSMVSFAANLKKVNLTGAQLTVGHYTNTSLTGELVLNSANSDVAKETKNLVNNSKAAPYYWSVAYKFDQLKAYGGNLVPAILIDVAKGGAGVNICGFDMTLREAEDCVPYSFEIQATTSADSSEWIKVFEDADTAADWNGADYHCEFPEVTVYKVRILFYDLGDADSAFDTAYGQLRADETRFSLAEIGLLQQISSGSTNTTDAPTVPATRPVISVPTQAPTAAPTQAPTAAPTAAPTQAPTAAPTVAPTQAPTAAPTAAPTVAPTQAATSAPTVAPTVAPTEAPTWSDSSSGNIETLPTEAPTEEPTLAPSEAPGVITTVPATAPATQPEATTGTTDNGAAEEPKDFTAVIIIAIVAAAAIAGGTTFFIIKKKRG